MMKNISFAAAIIAAAATFTACSSEDGLKDILPGQTGAEQVQKQTYSMTVSASKTTLTRALSLDGNTLNATWAAGEKVTVRNVTKGADLEGELEAQSDGVETTLKGDLTGTVEVGDELLLKFCSASYTSQSGTLEYIAANCDYAEATVEVTAVSGGRITATNATFDNKQAIVKFILKDYEDNAVEARRLVVETGVSTYTVTLASKNSEIWVALPGVSSADIKLTAYDETLNPSHVYERSGVTLSDSKYYTIAVKMNRLVNVYYFDGQVTDGDILSGSTKPGDNKHITIADGATVTLNGANINGTDKNEYTWAGLTCEGDATIILKGDNSVKGFCADYPGIYVPEGSTLTIQGDGSLNASSNGWGAGIGGGTEINCGNIVILSGTITATGGDNSAGIGSGWGSCGTITISGGTIIAIGGSGDYPGAGIGCADGGSCDNITISGGTVIATGGNNTDSGVGCPGIGSAYDATCGDITITAGVTSVTATKGEGATNSIGAGDDGFCGTITIEDPSKVIEN